MQRQENSEEKEDNDYEQYNIYSDLNKIGQHFPKWGITKSLAQTISEIAESWIAKAEQ